MPTLPTAGCGCPPEATLLAVPRALPGWLLFVQNCAFNGLAISPGGKVTPSPFQMSKGQARRQPRSCARQSRAPMLRTVIIMINGVFVGAAVRSGLRIRYLLQIGLFGLNPSGFQIREGRTGGRLRF
jgi:hypothetical protein